MHRNIHLPNVAPSIAIFGGVNEILGMSSFDKGSNLLRVKRHNTLSTKFHPIRKA